MRDGLKRILARVSIALVVLATAMAGAFTAAAPAQAGGWYTYTMSCGTTWDAELEDGDFAYTYKDLSYTGTCTSDYAWINAQLGRYGWTGKQYDYGEVWVWSEYLTASWHSGCNSGCHAHTIY